MKSIRFDKLKKPYITDLNDYFFCAKQSMCRLNWLITDYECNVEPKDYFNEEAAYIWIDGVELEKIVSQSSIQFIWGIISGFGKSIPKDVILAMGEPKFTQIFSAKDIFKQNSAVNTQILAVDSSYSIITSEDTTMLKQLTDTYLGTIL